MTRSGGDRSEMLEATLRDAVDRMRYTYKTHEKAADRYARYESHRKNALIVLTTLATGSFVASLVELFLDRNVSQLITGALAVLATLVAMLGDFLDFNARQCAHSTAGVKVRGLFVAYENLLADYLDGALTSVEVRIWRDALAVEEESLLLELPRTSTNDYEKAGAALESNEKTSEHQDRVSKTDRVTLKQGATGE